MAHPNHPHWPTVLDKYKDTKMLKHTIEIAKQKHVGMVKVSFRDGWTSYVNISDVVLLANNRVRVGTTRCACSKIKSIQDGSEIYYRGTK